MLTFVMCVCLCFLPLTAGSCSPMDDTWKRFGDSCYYVSTGAGDEARTWREARAWCLNKSADLVSITSQKEQLFLQTLVSLAPHPTFSHPPPYQRHTLFQDDNMCLLLWIVGDILMFLFLFFLDTR